MPEKPDNATDLPLGHWAVFRDPNAITDRELRPLKATLTELERASKTQRGVGEVAVTGAINPMAGNAFAAPSAPEISVDDLMDLMDAFEHESMAFFVMDWDFDLPVKPDAFYDIPVVVKNAIDKITGPLLQEMFPGVKDAEGRPTTP